jgi:arylsulfatase A-like enzyme
MRPNLVMITLDCVRPDHLGCYGYRGVETPHLDRLAAGGLLFQQAVTHAPNTWVAHATLFTGELPAVHGLRAPTHKISEDSVTLAEWLSGHGYSTAAFPGTTLVGRSQGFHRGFGLFDETWQSNGWQVEEVLWRRDWGSALPKAFEWMSHAREPFFLWLHYMDTHHLPACDLPAYFRSRFSSLWQYYDGKISYADQVCVGKLLEFLTRLGFRDRTVLAVFSDHGEELHDDDRPLHDRGLRDDVIRVPLVLGLPRTVERSISRVDRQVGLMDLFPTVCRLLNLPTPHPLSGRCLVDSEGAPTLTHEHGMAYLENWPRGLLGVRTEEWKLILRRTDPSERQIGEVAVEGLYHLPTDSGEQVDVSGSHPSVVSQLRAYALERSCGPSTFSMTPEESDRVRRALRGLGYL